MHHNCGPLAKANLFGNLERGMERRLAAVLIADVVGYSRLSQADEEGTRVRFQADLHEIFEPTIAKHHGRLVKTMGDGVLVEFRSVVDAIRCAVEVQSAKAMRSAAIPTDQRLAFRIGVNLGDVIVEGDDIHGDGVIIAERLQGIAEPGSVMISGTAYDQVKNKVDVGFEFLGERPVKNIAEPVRAYLVLTDPAAAGMTVSAVEKASKWRSRALAAAALLLVIAVGAMAWVRPWEAEIEPAPNESMALALPDKPSIAVLPFTNMSADPDQEYFADGMTDDLITELSQVSELFVISRNSTFAYKGKAIDVRHVAKELGVRYVLEGSVQRAGDQVRINAQLIDAVNGGHVWANRYDGPISKVFELEDKVTHSITDALALRLTTEEQQSIGRAETSVPAAYDAFLRGWEHFRRATPEDFGRAIPYFEQAIKLDPNYGRAHAALALVYWSIADANWFRGAGISTDLFLGDVTKYLREAEIHPTSTSHQVVGNLAMTFGEYPKAIAELKEAIALDPSDSWSYAYMARTLTLAGRPTDALQYIRTAMRVDPHYPPAFLFYLGFAQFSLEQFEEAAVSFEKAIKLNPSDESGFLFLGATYGYLGQKQEAVSAIAAYDALARGQSRPTLTARYAWHWWTYLKRADRDRLFDGLLLAEVPEVVPTSP